MNDIDTLITQLHDLKSDTPDDQFKAAIDLGGVTDAGDQDRIVSELIKALSSNHQALTRAHAVESLEKRGSTKAIPALIEALKDDYRLVRAYAARALGILGDPKQTIYPLISILAKEDEYFPISFFHISVVSCCLGGRICP